MAGKNEMTQSAAANIQSTQVSTAAPHSSKAMNIQEKAAGNLGQSVPSLDKLIFLVI